MQTLETPPFPGLIFAASAPPLWAGAERTAAAAVLTGLPTGPTAPVVVPPPVAVEPAPFIRPATTVPAAPTDGGLVPLAPPTATPIPSPSTTPGTPAPISKHSTGGSVAVVQVTGQPALSVKQTLPEKHRPRPACDGRSERDEHRRQARRERRAHGLVDRRLRPHRNLGHELHAQRQARLGPGRHRRRGNPHAQGEAQARPGTTAPPKFRSGFDATFSSSSSDTRSVKVLKPELGLQIVAPEMAMLGQPLTVNIKVKNPGQGRSARSRFKR